MPDPDPVSPAATLTRALVRCPSVTPEDGGALDVLADALRPLGFRCEFLSFETPGTQRVRNLYARLGAESPHFCFAGHTDVVPPGDAARWTAPPFEGAIRDGLLIGRGAADMKGAIAAFVTAASAFLESGRPFRGSISLLITGDEEGVAINGTRRMLDWLAERGERIAALESQISALTLSAEQNIAQALANAHAASSVSDE